MFGVRLLVTVAVEMTFSKDSRFFIYLRFAPVLRMVLPGLVVLILVSGCALGDSRSDSKDVIYSLEVNGNADLFRIDSETGDSIRMTTSAGADVAPEWSPNKELLAFISDINGISALWLMDSDGESKRQVSGASDDVRAFRWSPDSVRIAVETNGVSGGVISILDTESGDSIALTAPSENVRVGDWSPDGEWVVYSVIEGANSAIRRRNPTGVDEITLFTGRAVNPRWSRNGQWIAFDRVNEDGSVDLVVMDKDGENESVVATGVNASDPHDWTPDSKRLVYLSGAGVDAEIFVVGRDGKDVTQLTSNRVADAAPRWSPDGSSILFLSEGGGSFDVYSMDKDGGQQVRMTSTDDLVLGADW